MSAVLPRALVRALLAAVLLLSVAASTVSLSSTPAAAATTLQSRVAAIAPHYVGAPYRYGGTSPKGFDCSGYTGYVYRSAGKAIPRTSGDQYRAAHRVYWSGLRKGDLVFFLDHGHVYHVGIYAGNYSIWHAPAPGQKVKLQRIWTHSWVAGRV